MSDEENTPLDLSFWDHLANAVGALRRVSAQRDVTDERDAKATARARAKATVTKMSAPTAFSGSGSGAAAKASCCIASRKLKGDSTS